MEIRCFLAWFSLFSIPHPLHLRLTFFPVFFFCKTYFYLVESAWTGGNDNFANFSQYFLFPYCIILLFFALSKILIIFSYFDILFVTSFNCYFIYCMFSTYLWIMLSLCLKREMGGLQVFACLMYLENFD